MLSRVFKAFLLLVALGGVAGADIGSIVTFPDGSNGDVQFNKNRRFGADAGQLTYSTTTKVFTSPIVRASTIVINGLTYYFPTSQTGNGFLKTNGSGGLTWATPTNTTTSTGVALGILDGNTTIVNTVSSITFNASQFIVSLIGNTTASVALDPSVVSILGPSIDLASEVAGSLPAPSIAAGNLGASVVASSIAVGSVLNNSIVSVAGSKVTGDISGNAAGITGTVNVDQVVGAVSVYPATSTIILNSGVRGSGFNATTSSLSVTGAGGLKVQYGLTTATATVTGSTISLNGVTYYLPADAGTSGQALTSSGGTTASTLTWTTISGSGSGMAAGATYYVQVRDSLQSGATFYVSSGTVNSLNISSGGYLKSLASGTTMFIDATLGGINSGGVVIRTGPATASGNPYVKLTESSLTLEQTVVGPPAYPSINLCNGTGCNSLTATPSYSSPVNGWYFDATPALTGWSALISQTTTTIKATDFNVTGNTRLGGALFLSSGVYISGSQGTNGQVLTSGGAGANPSWTSVSGSGDNLGSGVGSYGVSTSSGGFTGAAGVTVTYGITAGSATIGGLNVNTAFTNVGTSTASLQTQINSVGLATGTLRTSLNTVATDTTSLRTSLNTVATDTTTLYANTIHLTSTIQTGATAYISSMTITNELNMGDGIHDAQVQLLRNGILGQAIVSTTTAANTVGHMAVWSSTWTLGDGGVPGSGTGMSPNATYYVNVTQTLQSGATFYVSSGTVNALNIGSTLQVAGASGTSGQFLKSNGVGAVPTWATPAGTGDAVLAATQTWSGGNTLTGSTTFYGAVSLQNVSTLTLTNASLDVTYGATVGTATIKQNLTVGASVQSNLNLNNGSVLTFKSPNNTGLASIQSQNNSAGTLYISAADGIGINNSANLTFGGTLIYPDNVNRYGAFAVAGSSADASVTWSGFTSTNNVNQSTLWSLPRRDGTAGQIIATDGAGHLSFATDATGGGGADNLGSGVGSYGIATTTGGYTGAAGVTVTYGVVAGSFTGLGTGLTGLVGANITTIIPSGVLPSTVAYYSSTGTFTANDRFVNTVYFSSSIVVNGFTGADQTADTSNRSRIKTTGIISIESADLDANNSAGVFVNMASTNTGLNPFFSTRRSSGTIAVPRATESGMVMGRVGASGFDGVNWIAASNASVDLIAIDTFTATANGTAIAFKTTAVGATASTERLRISGSGAVTATSSVTIQGPLGLGVTYGVVAGSLTANDLSASLPVQTDTNKKLVSAAVDLSGTQATGALAAGRFPALTGDITTSAGNLATTIATTIANAHTFTGAITHNTSSTTFNAAVNVSTSILLNGSVGTSGQALLSQGPGAADVWGNPTAAPGGSSGNIQWNSGSVLSGLLGSSISGNTIIISTSGINSYLTVVSSFQVNGGSFTVNSGMMAINSVSTMTNTAMLNQNNEFMFQGKHGQTGQMVLSSGSVLAPMWGPTFQLLRSTSNFTITGQTLIKVPQLETTLLANSTYQIDCNVVFQTTAAVLGATVGMFTAAGSTPSLSVQIPQAADGTSAFFFGTLNSAGDSVISISVPVINTNYTAKIYGDIFVGTAGNLYVEAAAEGGGSNLLTMAGSSCLVIGAVP